MVRAPCCSKVGLHRGPWTAREDTLLTKYIRAHGEGHWRSLPKKAGLLRCGKSCRLRWMNYLRPDIKRGNITPDEDDLIIRLHALLGNRWSLIAGRLPGRTDNEIKNYWNTHLSKRLRTQGTDPITHMKLSSEPPVVHGGSRNKRTRNNSNGTKKLSGGGGGGGKSNNKSKAISSSSLPEEQAPPPPPPPAEKHKVHLPKPIRVTSYLLPRNESFASSGFGTEGLEEVPCNSSKDGGDQNGPAAAFLFGDDDDHQNLVNGSDFESQSQTFTGESSLEKLYDEYLQILENDDDDEQVQWDDFAESLLI